MTHTAQNIINAFTSLDEMMQFGNGPIMLLTPQQMFEMGQFYEWAKPTVNDANIDMNSTIIVPDDIEWVIGETHGW